jgi:hypothetical protein
MSSCSDPLKRPSLPLIPVWPQPLCGDVTPRALRVPEDDVRRHANGVIGVAAIAIAVENPEVSAWRYGALLDVAAGSIALTSGQPVSLVGPGQATASLAARGEGPLSLSLRVAAGSATGEFDVQRTHGVRMDHAL